MPAEKVSLSLDSALLRKARQVAGRRGLSALVNDALRIRLQHERLRALLADMDSEFGPVPAAASLPNPARRRPRRSRASRPECGRCLPDPTRAWAAWQARSSAADPDDLRPLLAGFPRIQVIAV